MLVPFEIAADAGVFHQICSQKSQIVQRLNGVPKEIEMSQPSGVAY
jgi:hypothetical protein